MRLSSARELFLFRGSYSAYSLFVPSDPVSGLNILVDIDMSICKISYVNIVNTFQVAYNKLVVYCVDFITWKYSLHNMGKRLVVVTLQIKLLSERGIFKMAKVSK